MCNNLCTTVLWEVWVMLASCFFYQISLSNERHQLVTSHWRVPKFSAARKQLSGLWWWSWLSWFRFHSQLGHLRGSAVRTAEWNVWCPHLCCGYGWSFTVKNDGNWEWAKFGTHMGMVPWGTDMDRHQWMIAALRGCPSGCTRGVIESGVTID